MPRCISLLAIAIACMFVAAPAQAINYVPAANGITWDVNDAAMPGLDTGSIRAVTDNSVLSVAGLRVSVAATPKHRMDGELLRGFGLTFDGVDEFTTTKAVVLSGIEIKRHLRFARTANWGRWVDSFNITSTPKEVKVTFGGIFGQNNGENQSEVVDSSSGDTAATAADAWVEVATPNASATTPTSGPTQNGPSAIVLGTAGTTLRGALTRTANFMRNPFANALATEGMEANFRGYLRTITIAPNECTRMRPRRSARRSSPSATTSRRCARELRQEGERWIAHYEVDAGPAIKIASVDLRITGAGADDPRVPADRRRVPAAAGRGALPPRLRGRARRRWSTRRPSTGYLDANFETSEIRVDLERYRRTSSLHFDTGPRYRFGEVTLPPGRPRSGPPARLRHLQAGRAARRRQGPGDAERALGQPLLEPRRGGAPPGPGAGAWRCRSRSTWCRPSTSAGPAAPATARTPARAARGAWSCGGSTAAATAAQVEIRASQIEQSFQASYQIPGPYPRTDVLSFNSAYAPEITDTSESETGLVGARRTQSRGGWREAFVLTFQREDFEVGLDEGIRTCSCPARAGAGQGRRPDLHHQRLPAALRRSGAPTSVALRLRRSSRRRSRASRSAPWATAHRLIARAQVGYTRDRRVPRAAPAVPLLRRRRPERARLRLPGAGRARTRRATSSAARPCWSASLEYELPRSSKSGAAPSSTTPATPSATFGDPLEHGAGRRPALALADRPDPRRRRLGSLRGGPAPPLPSHYRTRPMSETGS